MTRAIAIDFGTSRTKLAYAPGDGGRPELMRFGNDRPFVRSLVYLPPDSTGILWGEDAEHRLASDPGGIIDVPKRRLAEPWLRAAGGRKETPQQVLTVVFSDLRRWAGERIKAFAGQPPERLTLTLPGLYRPVEERTVRAAAAAAGFAEDAITPIAEPVAAAQAWLAETGGDDDDVIVLDAGGGTFDWAWLRRQGGAFQLVPECPPGGDRELGGHDVDLLLFELLQEKAGDTAAAAILARRAQWLDRLRALKENYCLGHPLRPLPVEDREIAISEREIAAAIEQRFVVQVCDALAGYLDKVRTIAGGGLPPLLLVGGSGRLRGLATALNERLGCPTVQWDRAEFATALGCIPWKKKRIDVMDKTIITCSACKQKMRVPARGEIVATCPGCRGQISVRDGRLEDDVPDAEYESTAAHVKLTRESILSTSAVKPWIWTAPAYVDFATDRFDFEQGFLSEVDSMRYLRLGLAKVDMFQDGKLDVDIYYQGLIANCMLDDLKPFVRNSPRLQKSFLGDFVETGDIEKAKRSIKNNSGKGHIHEAIFLESVCKDITASRQILDRLNSYYDYPKCLAILFHDYTGARKALEAMEKKHHENGNPFNDPYRLGEPWMLIFNDRDRAEKILRDEESSIPSEKNTGALKSEPWPDERWIRSAFNWINLLDNHEEARRCLKKAEPFVKWTTEWLELFEAWVMLLADKSEATHCLSRLEQTIRNEREEKEYVQRARDLMRYLV